VIKKKELKECKKGEISHRTTRWVGRRRKRPWAGGKMWLKQMDHPSFSGNRKISGEKERAGCSALNGGKRFNEIWDGTKGCRKQLDSYKLQMLGNERREKSHLGGTGNVFTVWVGWVEKIMAPLKQESM